MLYKQWLTEEGRMGFAEAQLGFYLEELAQEAQRKGKHRTDWQAQAWACGQLQAKQKQGTSQERTEVHRHGIATERCKDGLCNSCNVITYNIYCMELLMPFSSHCGLIPRI